jgi:hypothetical protein
MRFMSIVTSSQPPAQPTAALLDAMHKLADREIKPAAWSIPAG